jgi:hypothetical protein
MFDFSRLNATVGTEAMLQTGEQYAAERMTKP